MEVVPNEPMRLRMDVDALSIVAVVCKTLMVVFTSSVVATLLS